MKIKLSAILILTILFSCSSNENKTDALKDSTISQPSDLATEEKAPSPMAMIPEKLKAKVAKLDSMYSKTIFYVKVEDQYLFYVVKGKWPNSETSKFNSGNFKVGIVDENLNELVPCEYDKIYNPNATAQYWIEIEKSGKKGLFNYRNKTVVAPMYDMIFPATDIIAIGKKGNDYFEIDNGDKPYLPLPKDKIPTYNKIAKKWNLDKDNKNLLMLLDLNPIEIPDSENGTITNNGFVFSPSFLYNLGVVPEYTNNLDINNSSDFVQNYNKLSIDDSKSLGDGIIAYVTSFYKEGVNARDYTEQEYSYVITDQKNNVVDHKKIDFRYNGDFSERYCNKEDLLGYKYLNGNLFEVKSTKHYESKYSVYNTMPNYFYYLVTKSGKIDSLTTNRIFTYTKFVEINESYFRGLFAKELSEKEIEATNEESNMGIAEHLTIEDLDFMINEIYAEYGYKFKGEKWKNHFEKTRWYKPQYDEVEGLFSELDKKNIKFIKEYREKMKGKEKSFTKPQLIMYVAAG